MARCLRAHPPHIKYIACDLRAHPPYKKIKKEKPQALAGLGMCLFVF